MAAKDEIAFEELLDYPIMAGELPVYIIPNYRSISPGTPILLFLHTVSQISAIAGFVRQIPCIGAVLESTPLPPNVVRLQVTLKDAAIPVGLLQSRNVEYQSSSKKLLMQYVTEELESHFPIKKESGRFEQGRMCSPTILNQTEIGLSQTSM
ncbi:hypothetical protein ACFSQ7_35825 [Paenibacillus rhizoplanae]